MDVRGRHENSDAAIPGLSSRPPPSTSTGRTCSKQVALPCGSYFEINGGRAKIDGGEIEVSAHPVRRSELRLGAGYEKDGYFRVPAQLEPGRHRGRVAHFGHAGMERPAGSSCTRGRSRTPSTAFSRRTIALREQHESPQ